MVVCVHITKRVSQQQVTLNYAPTDHKFGGYCLEFRDYGVVRHARRGKELYKCDCTEIVRYMGILLHFRVFGSADYRTMAI